MAAPAALLLGATVAVLLVRSALEAGTASAPAPPGPAASGRPPAAPAAGRPRPARPRPGRPRPRFYAVRAGDTLETIAARHRTSVERLLALNPGTDPAALTVGQRVRVR